MMAQLFWIEFWEIVLGGMSPIHFFAYVCLMGAGAFVYFALDVNNSRKESALTPKKFNFKFMVRENVPRFIAVLIMICAAVIWYEDFFGVPLNPQLAFISGLGIDALIGSILKTKKNSNGGRATRAKLLTSLGLEPEI
jgi:hypothetical protein